jgi:hypothetical protein
MRINKETEINSSRFDGGFLKTGWYGIIVNFFYTFVFKPCGVI